MDQRTRLFKTLGCLVAAMTGTSALLGWIDPSPPISPEAPSLDAVMAEARLLIAQETSGIPWSDVQIVASPVTPEGPSYLAASAGRDDCDFRVGLDGRPSRVRTGILNPVTEKHPEAARIQVVRRSLNAPMSRAQWVCVQALVAAMGEAVGDRPIPVRLGEAWARIYGMDAQTVLEISSAGGKRG
jgi:hypothetical protein